jgi:hypothetical protein
MTVAATVAVYTLGCSIPLHKLFTLYIYTHAIHIFTQANYASYLHYTVHYIHIYTSYLRELFILYIHMLFTYLHTTYLQVFCSESVCSSYSAALGSDSRRRCSDAKLPTLPHPVRTMLGSYLCHFLNEITNCGCAMISVVKKFANNPVPVSVKTPLQFERYKLFLEESLRTNLHICLLLGPNRYANCELMRNSQAQQCHDLGCTALDDSDVWLGRGCNAARYCWNSYIVTTLVNDRACWARGC